MNTNTHTHTHTHTHAPSRKHIEETKNFAAKMSEFTGLKGDAHPSNLVNTQWKVCVCVYVRKREKVCVCIGMSLYSYLLSHTHTHYSYSSPRVETTKSSSFCSPMGGKHVCILAYVCMYACVCVCVR
jgi:hypothetical protein